MLLLEMAGQEKECKDEAENSSRVYYPSWIYEKLHENEGIEISNTYEILLSTSNEQSLQDA